jgi:hypothetical protein
MQLHLDTCMCLCRTPKDSVMFLQRDQLAEALAEVSRYEPGRPLARLFRIIHKTEGGHWVVKFQSAEGATLHMVTTRLAVKKGRPGPVEDCYGFVPFERGQGEEVELCIMEIQGIGALRWLTEQEDIDADELMANPGQQAGDNVPFQGAGTSHFVMWRSFCGSTNIIHTAVPKTSPIVQSVPTNSHKQHRRKTPCTQC